MIPTYYLLRDGLIDEKKVEDPLHVSIYGVVVISGTLLFPIGGWLADAHLGRYKTVHYSMLIMWIGAILVTVGEIIAEFSGTYSDHIKMWVYRVICIIVFAGLVGFLSNTVQLGTDQLFNASASEISSFILWIVLGIYASAFCSQLVSECISSVYNMFYIRTFTVVVCLSLALCSDFACKDWVVKEEVSRQSLSEVWRIIWYIIKNRKVKYDFVTQGNELTTLFDVAKHQHGGPFTSLQVDNVRTFLWMIVILATCGVVFGAITPIEYAREKIQYRWDGNQEAKGLAGCYMKLTLHYEDSIIIVVLVSLYEFFIRPIFYKCLPKGSIINRFVIGTALFFLWIMSLLAIESYAYSKHVNAGLNNSVECIFKEDQPEIKFNQLWFLIPDFLSGISRTLLYVTAFEFIWAQTPSTMKGLMLGVAFTTLGLNTLLQGIISAPFLFKFGTLIFYWHPLTCGIWYFIMEGVLTLVVLMGTMFVVVKYKKKDQKIVFDGQTYYIDEDTYYDQR